MMTPLSWQSHYSSIDCHSTVALWSQIGTCLNSCTMSPGETIQALVSLYVKGECCIYLQDPRGVGTNVFEVSRVVPNFYLPCVHFVDYIIDLIFISTIKQKDRKLVTYT